MGPNPTRARNFLAPIANYLHVLKLTNIIIISIINGNRCSNNSNSVVLRSTVLVFAFELRYVQM
jgi:hypothetical protein